MAPDEKQKNYRIECMEDENGNVPEAGTEQVEEPLASDPLDNLPDISSKTGGLPIVTFVLIGLSACAIMLIERMLTADSALIAMCCVVADVVLVFGMASLIRGMFHKLRQQKEDKKWYPISAAVMFAGIVIGLIAGVISCL